jgi:YbbR domain-containing protein
MVRDRIKKVFSSRIFYIIFSILASITVWLFVSYIENPDISVTIRNIKIEVLNRDIVTNRGFVVTAINTDTVTLRLTGKRNIVSRLSKSNIAATVDFADIEKAGVTLLEYDIIYPIDVNPSSFTTTKSIDRITVTVDNLVDKEVPVRCTYDGGVVIGYQIDEPFELTPATITVSGPQDVLSKISYAWVPVHRENISKTIEDDLPFTLMDSSGHEVVSDKLTFSHDTIHVVIRVVMLKDVPLQINMIYGAGADETNTVITISPETVKLSGDAEILNGYNQIPLGTIDLTKYLNGPTAIFPIVIPNEVTNITGIKDATVTVSITGLESTHVTTDNIQVINVPDGYTATLITQSMDVLLRGTPAGIDELIKIAETTPGIVRITADLSEYGATSGTISAIAKVNVDGNVTTVGAIGEYKVSVTLTKD